MVQLKRSNFGTFNGSAVEKFTWDTKGGFSVSVISYGATITSIKVPDRNNEVSDVVLGFDDLASYISRNVAYFGATVGRCANRIGGASFTIGDSKYTVAANIGRHHLHGGIVGFDKVNWYPTVVGTKVIFTYLSKDGEEGYPGDLVISTTYDVTDQGHLLVEYQAMTTKATVANLTNHSYFNLAGHDAGSRELYEHVVSINADNITETDKDSIPTGRLTRVGGTPFDFRIPTRLGDVIDKAANLFDDNFCITPSGNEGTLNFVSRVSHPRSGRFLEVYSNQPGVQFYTGNFLSAPTDAAIVGKDGVGYRRHGALCFETQKYPDAVNHPNFPSAILQPGQVYQHKVNWYPTVVGTKVIFTYLSKDGEEGYPGDLVISTTYDVTDQGHLLVEYQAMTTKATVANLTNHSYFNLAGHDAGSRELYEHVVSINADNITETDKDSIPTGRLTRVGGTPFDFRIPTRLGDVIDKAVNLFDDNFCITPSGNEGTLNFVSRVSHPRSGRFLEVYSNQPGVQFYTGNFLSAPTDAAIVGKDGVGYRRHGALCFETQKYPDAVNHPNFPSAILQPGQVYQHKVTYIFGAKSDDAPRVVSS